MKPEHVHAELHGSDVDGTRDQQVSGLAVAARQALIAKCFGCPWITFFNYAPVPGTTIMGVNETYGVSFFNRINATINAPNDTMPITIRVYPHAGNADEDLAQILFLPNSVAWAWFYVAGLARGFRRAVDAPCRAKAAAGHAISADTSIFSHSVQAML